MIQQWQSEYDTATAKKSFHEIDFDKLAKKYITKDLEVYLEKSISTSGGSLKAETKQLLSRNIQLMKKYLLPEIELLENRHLLNFLSNIIKFTKIEHLYLFSTPEVQFSAEISPNVHLSAQRFIRLVADIHLMYSYADAQKGDDFRRAKSLFLYVINVFKRDFCPLVAKYHKSPPKDKSNYSLLEYLYQLNAHLENFDRVIDHKEYNKVCSAQGSRVNLDDNSISKNSGRNLLKGDKERNNDSILSQEGNSDKSTSSYLSTESNSLRNMFRERKQALGQSNLQGFGHSRIASTSFEQMPTSLLSSNVSQTKSDPVENVKNTSSITVEYVKNTPMYSRTLGDLKQYKELKGLKLINETYVFPKLEDEESRKKTSPSKQRIIKLKEEHEQNLNPFDLIEVSELVGKDVKVTVTEPHRAWIKTWEEAKKKQEEAKRQVEEQKKLTEKKKKEKGPTEHTQYEYSLKNIEEQNSDSDDDAHFDGFKSPKKSEYRRAESLSGKDISEDYEYESIANTFHSVLDQSPSVLINNYTFFRPNKLEYQIPQMDYLERTEKIREKPSEYAEDEEDFEDYCYTDVVNRRQFLTRLFGEKTRQKMYQELDDVYSASQIKPSETNSILTEDLLKQLNDGLENKKIKKLAKDSSSKESVFFLMKQRLVTLGEIVEDKNEDVKRKEKKDTKGSELWAKLRFAVRMRSFIGRLVGKQVLFEIHIVNFRTRKLLGYLSQDLNNETKEDVESTRGHKKARTKPIGRFIKRKECSRVFSSFQGSYILLNSDKCEIQF